jgi:hypothetical protein
LRRQRPSRLIRARWLHQATSSPATDGSEHSVHFTARLDGPRRSFSTTVLVTALRRCAWPLLAGYGDDQLGGAARGLMVGDPVPLDRGAGDELSAAAIHLGVDVEVAPLGQEPDGAGDQAEMEATDTRYRSSVDSTWSRGSVPCTKYRHPRCLRLGLLAFGPVALELLISHGVTIRSVGCLADKTASPGTPSGPAGTGRPRHSRRRVPLGRPHLPQPR